jgi:hypothetical protein
MKTVSEKDAEIYNGAAGRLSHSIVEKGKKNLDNSI